MGWFMIVILTVIVRLLGGPNRSYCWAGGARVVKVRVEFIGVKPSACLQLLQECFSRNPPPSLVLAAVEKETHSFFPLPSSRLSLCCPLVSPHMVNKRLPAAQTEPEPEPLPSVWDMLCFPGVFPLHHWSREELLSEAFHRVQTRGPVGLRVLTNTNPCWTHSVPPRLNEVNFQIRTNAKNDRETLSFPAETFKTGVCFL